MEYRLQTLKNLSANIYIEELLGKYYSLDITEDNIKFWEGMWEYLSHQNRISCIAEFYLAIVTYSTNILQKSIVESPCVVYSIDALFGNISNYFGYNVSIMSDEIIGKAYKNYEQTLSCEGKKGSESDFFNLLIGNKKTFVSLLNNFPLWKRNLMRFLDSTTNYLIQVFKRLGTDFDEIKKLFCTDDLSIINIFLEQGDRHHDSFVVKLQTNCGYLFYKPRSNNIDQAFTDIVEELQILEKSILDIKLPYFYGGNDYSWVRGVSYKPLDSRKEEELYYRRIGHLLAIFYILDGNDMHYENMISEAEYPIPIDIETLFSTKLFLNKQSHSAFISKNEINYSATSVKNIGFLPTFVKLNNKSFDISSINIEEMGNSHGVNHVNKKEHLHSAGKCYLNLEEIERKILSGFEIVYWTFVNNKDTLIPKIYEIVRDLEIRYLNHMTAEYGIIKDSILKPICFYNPQYAFAITSRIFNSLKDPGDVELYEQRELLNLNIPYFKVKVNDGNLILNNNNEITNFFRKSPWQLFYEKTRYLGEEDFEYQTTIIKKMFVARKGIKLHETKEFAISEKKYRQNSDDSRKICQDILKDILKSSNKNPVNGEHTWIEYQLSGEHYEVVNVPNNFYSGLFGVIKVLVSDCDIYSRKQIFVFVEEALALIRKVIDTDIRGMLTGAYDGIGVYINCLRDMANANIIQQDEYEMYLKKLLGKCLEIYRDDKKIDVLNGNAGLLLSLLHALEGENTVDLKLQILKVLENVKQEVESNIYSKSGKYYFPVDGSTTTYFNGYAHGSSGIIVALFKTIKKLNDDNWSLIEKLLNTQRAHFDREKGVWYNDNKHSKSSWGWCHGIPGILLSRLELMMHGYRDSQIVNEIEILAELSFNKGLGFNTTFCHGDMAIITILELAIKMGYCRYLKEQVEGYKVLLIKNILSKWNLHSIRGTEVVGMMDGLAGIAYFLSCSSKNMIPIDVLTITNGGSYNA